MRTQPVEPAGAVTLPAAVALSQARCRPLGPTARLRDEALVTMLARVPGWSVDGERLHKRFGFKRYDQTMAFVQAVAALAEAQDHHPVLLVEFGACTVWWSTHDAQGLTVNDFICAAQVDALPR